MINHHFLSCWRGLDSTASRNRGLVSLMRRHRHNLSPAQSDKLTAYLASQPVLELIYRFKQRLCYLPLKKHRTRKQCQKLVPRLLRAIFRLRHASLAPLVQVGAGEIVAIGASLATRQSPKAFTPKWKFCNAKPMAFATSKTPG
jgi:Transposase